MGAVLTHPIARVATDREPTAASHQSGAWHWTWVGNDADSRVGLPRKLMAALSASGIARVFDSRDAAMDALSLACVNLGRAAAGPAPGLPAPPHDPTWVQTGPAPLALH